MEAPLEQEDVYDARFEFDAPRFYDFETMNTGTPADKWFDTAPDGPGCKPERPGSSREPFKPLQDNASNTQQQAAAAGTDAAAGGATAALQAAEQNPRKANIVTSWAGGAAGAAARKSCVAGARKSILPAAAGRKSSVPAVGPAANAAAGGAGVDGAASRPAPRKSMQGKQPRRVCSSSQAEPASASNGSHHEAAARTEPPVTRSISRLGMNLFSPVPENKPKYGSPPLTRSRTATQRFYTLQKSKSSVARTKPPAPLQKLHEVLAPKVTKPLRSTAKLTLPEEPQLQTSRRGGGRVSAAAAMQQPEHSPFKPLAERVREFLYKTPPRFKSKASKPAADKKRSPITRAEAPRLLTSARNRPRSCKSQQEIEEEQMRTQFKAKPVDTRVLGGSGQLGVPRVEKPQVTEPKPFNLRSDSRARMRRSHEQPNMQQAAAAAHFKAQPLNRSILDGPTFKPHKEQHGLTKAVSPELMTKRRALLGTSTELKPRTRSTTEQQQQQQQSSHGLQAGPLKLTQPQPFRLATEARGVLHEQELAAKLAAEEARAKRLRRVTARPLPVTVDVPVVPPKPDPKQLTLPEPFPLKSVARHEEYEGQHRARLQEEEEEARRAAEFKARPIATGGPFVVHESDAHLTVPEDLQLATDTRAFQRAEFDAHMAAKMQQEEEEQQRCEELKRKAEEEAVREYRKKLRFSARPMPSFDQPFFALPSEKRLTKPKTPNFASKKLRKDR